MQMMSLGLMMSASPNGLGANIASLRNEVEKHHYAKHNIMSRSDASLKVSVFCGIINLNRSEIYVIRIGWKEI